MLDVKRWRKRSKRSFCKLLSETYMANKCSWYLLYSQNTCFRSGEKRGGKTWQITSLGTGTSHGVPIITLHLSRFCTVTNPEKTDGRAVPFGVQAEGSEHPKSTTATGISPQAIEAGITHVGRGLYTHCHADHVFLVLTICACQSNNPGNVPIYVNEPTIAENAGGFQFYVFRKDPKGGR